MLGDLAWWVTLVILVREIGVTLLRFAVIRYGVIAASPGGKAKTFVQIIAIGLYILPLPESACTGSHAGAMGLAVILTVVTGIDYVIRACAAVLAGPRPAGQTGRPTTRPGRRGRPDGRCSHAGRVVGAPSPT